jgi:hypothetical protein
MHTAWPPQKRGLFLENSLKIFFVLFHKENNSFVKNTKKISSLYWKTVWSF